MQGHTLSERPVAIVVLVTFPHRILCILFSTTSMTSVSPWLNNMSLTPLDVPLNFQATNNYSLLLDNYNQHSSLQNFIDHFRTSPTSSCSTSSSHWTSLNTLQVNQASNSFFVLFTQNTLIQCTYMQYTQWIQALKDMVIKLRIENASIESAHLTLE